MPWKTSLHFTPHADFVADLWGRQTSFAEICRRHGISRQTGYKWFARFLQRGVEGLREESRCPRRCARQSSPELRVAVAALRVRYPTWGAKKLVWALRQRWPRRRLPHPRTVERWEPKRSSRARCIPILHARPPRPPARRPHEVWTVDFKGWFRTADGCRCEPLTVRDAATCYLLYARHVPAESFHAVQRAMHALFKRTGLPRRIRVDNGAPFAGTGALGLSRLSVWWLQLGIAVEFSRPGHPEDNPAHEQMHRVLKAETANPPAANIAAQNRRLERWRRLYNHARPHEGLGLHPPAHKYRCSPRPLPDHLPAWSYPRELPLRRVNSGGWISWAGRRRLIGRAFAHHSIALKKRSTYHLVYLGSHLLGELHPNDSGGLRPLRYSHHLREVGEGEGLRPSPSDPLPFK